MAKGPFQASDIAMTPRDRLKLFNQALQLCSLEEEASSRKAVPYQSFHSVSVNEAVTIVGAENLKSFDQVVNKLLEADRNVQETLSKKGLIERLIPVLREKKKIGGEFSLVDCDDFWKQVLSTPVIECRVLRELFGASILSSQPISLSCFKIYDWQKHKDLIPGIDNHLPTYWSESGHTLLIECKVHARDTEKALELADILFSQFESVMWFIIDDRSRYRHIGILNYTGSKLHAHYVFTTESTARGDQRTGPFEPLLIDTAHFLKPTREAARLLALIGRRRNRLEDSVLQSVHWIGEALTDRNAASAFVKAATGLEILLAGKEELITPSILHQISERCALLLGINTDSCIEIERKVKKLYGMRSSVVHGGKNTVSNENLDLIIYIAREVVSEILANDAYSELQSVEDLHHVLRLKKYSGSN